MAVCSCDCKRNCLLLAIIVSAIVGVVSAFLQIAGVITVAPVFAWVALGVALVYLAGLAVIAARTRSDCLCRSLSGVLAGILGTVLFSLVILAVGIVATSVVSAILVGLLVAFFALIVTATACLIRCLADCDD